MSDATILSVRDMRVHFKIKPKNRLLWAARRPLKARVRTCR